MYEVEIIGLKIEDEEIFLDSKVNDYKYLFNKAAVVLEKNGLWNDFYDDYLFDKE